MRTTFLNVVILNVLTLTDASQSRTFLDSNSVQAQSDTRIINVEILNVSTPSNASKSITFLDFQIPNVET